MFSIFGVGVFSNIYRNIGGWGVSPTGKSQWSLHACDPVAGVEPENSPPRAARACPWVRSSKKLKSCCNELKSGSMSSWSITGAS